MCSVLVDYLTMLYELWDCMKPIEITDGQTVIVLFYYVL